MEIKEKTKKKNGLKNQLKSRSERISMTTTFIFSMIWAVLVFYPFAWMIFNMLKTRQEFYFDPNAWPTDPIGNLKNLVVVFRDFDIPSMLVNTAYFAIVPPLLRVIILAGVSYAYAMFDFPGKKFLYYLAILPMIISIQGSGTGKMKLWLEWGLYDKPIAVILTCFSVFGYNFLVLGGFFKGCSTSYREAAEIDGAGLWQTYLQIYLPMAVPFLTAFFVLDFIGAWNDWGTPMIYYPSTQTLATGIYAIEKTISEGGGAWSRDYPKLFSAIFVTVIPCIILYASVQKIVRKMNIGGGLKG